MVEIVSISYKIHKIFTNVLGDSNKLLFSVWVKGPCWYILPRGDLPPANQLTNRHIAILDNFAQLGRNEEDIRDIMMTLQSAHQQRMHVLRQIRDLQEMRRRGYDNPLRDMDSVM